MESEFMTFADVSFDGIVGWGGGSHIAYENHALRTHIIMSALAYCT